MGKTHMSGLNVGRLLESPPWQLRKRPTVLISTLHLHTEAALLGHRGVEAGQGPYFRKIDVEGIVYSHIVSRKKCGVQRNVPNCRKAVLIWVVCGHVNNRVAVRLRFATV